MGRVLGSILLVLYVVILRCEGVSSEVVTRCEDGHKSQTFQLTCPADHKIAIIYGFCVLVEKCKSFEESMITSCDPNSNKTSTWNPICAFYYPEPCKFTCTGDSTYCLGDVTYASVEYTCEWMGTGDPPTIGTTSAVAPVTTKPACDTDQIEFKGSCYRFFHQESSDFYTAQSSCENLGMHLVNIESQEEQHFLDGKITDRSASGKGYWIGLSALNWLDGTHLTYDKFRDPDKAFNEGSQCFRLYPPDFKWYDEECFEEHSFICESNGDCGSFPSNGQHHEHSGSCYYISTENSTFSNSDSICQERGMHLVFIESESEQNFIETRLSDEKYWIGLTSTGWDENGSGLPYSNFGNHGAFNQGKVCFRMDPNHRFKWRDDICYTEYNYICEREGVNSIEDQTTKSISTLAPTDPQTSEVTTTEPISSTVPTTDEETTPTSTTQHQLSTEELQVTNTTQTTNIVNATQKPLEQILTECFDNVTEGESSAKPYRPLSFSTRGNTEAERLAVSFYSPFLQTKPVKVAVEAFQDPKPGCETSPSSSNYPSTSPSATESEVSGTSTSLNSVVNVTVYCYNGAPLHLRKGEYVDVVFPVKIDFDNEVPVCTSMKRNDSGWEWVTEDCKAVYSNYTHVTCRCNHLTAIALQRGPKGFKVDWINALLLSVLEKALGCISIIAIFVMLVIYATLGVKGSQLTKIQLNMAVSSFAGHVTFLLGMKATGNLLVCAIIAACLQYLYTVYALWLVVQTAVLFNTCYLHGKPRDSKVAQPVQMKVPEKSSTEPIRMVRAFLIVWGGPLVLVGLLYKKMPHGFGTPESCWLTEKENVYPIFIAIVTMALVINFVLALLTVVYLVKIDDKPTEHIDGYAEWTEKLRNRVSLCLSSSLVLSFVLVMAWSSHALFVFKSIMAFDYLFILFNMIQGFLVFVSYCPMNPQVRAAIFRTGNTPDEDEKKEKEPN